MIVTYSIQLSKSRDEGKRGPGQKWGDKMEIWDDEQRSMITCGGRWKDKYVNAVLTGEGCREKRRGLH